MKSILIIGMGRFGHHLAMDFLEHGHDVMVIDENEERMSDMIPYATSIKIGDCTKMDVLKSLGIRNFDVIFVCIGTNFQSSLEVTSLVKELGAKRVISKATRDIQAKFLLKNGADEAIYPNRDSAERIGVKYGTNKVFDYIEMTEGYSMYEVPPLKKWIGKSIREIDVRAKYGVSIIAIKEENQMDFTPSITEPLREDQHLLIVGQQEAMERLLKQ